MIPLQARRATYEQRERFSLLPPKEVLLISGCRNFEVAEEAFLGHEYRGAMTYFIEQAIRRLGSAATYQQVIDETRRDLARSGFSQIPQLTGRPEWLGLPAYT